MSLLTTFEKLLASRFLVPGAGGRLALLIAAIGCAGIMIGVASLVLVVSFMNGAEVRLAGQIAMPLPPAPREWIQASVAPRPGGQSEASDH